MQIGFDACNLGGPRSSLSANNNIKGEIKMADIETFKGRKKTYVWVKDRAGNEFLCPAGSLKDPKHATEAELSNCVDDVTASVNPRGG